MQRKSLALLLSFALLLAGAAFAQVAAPPAAAPSVEAKVPVETFTLANGMRFLLVPRPELTTVSAGWVARVGSANEFPGITGLAHLFEHMLFKGTRTVGTTNIERDLEILAEQERLQQQIREIYREQRERARLGEIDDPFAQGARTPELEALDAQFQELVAEQRAIMVKDEFDQIYTEAGASGMNAFTSEDMTGYFITVPANKLELWFWMESDRLHEPVFREFYAERDVVQEERRLRTESTPTGRFDEQLSAMFWQSHPYGWPVVGWPSDLKVISKEQADRFFDTYYAPNNLTAVLVGNFEPAEVRRQAERYFGRLDRGERPPADVVTLEMPQLAEKRMIARCDCQPQVQVLYHTVPFRHRDSYALDVLAGLLNGRTGRLYKGLVLERQIASTASSSQSSMKWAGSFSFEAETRGDATPEQLEQAWNEELERLQREPVPAEELQKVKNQIAADAFRRLESPFFLLLQLIFYEGMGDWQYLNFWADRTQEVVAEDVQRVARQYLTPENRTVGLYFRQEGAAAAEELPAELAELPPEMRSMVAAQIRQLRQVEDSAQLGAIVAQLEQQRNDAPEPMQPIFDLLARVAQERLRELAAAGSVEEPR
jgi:predicted Zn-dependent peptidase